MDLLELRNRLKRDPDGFTQEFQQHLEHFKARLDSIAVLAQSGFQLDEQGDAFGSAKARDKALEGMAELIEFLSHAVPIYQRKFPEPAKWFPQDLLRLVQDEQNSPILTHELRKSVVQALVLLRNRRVVDPESILPVFLQMLGCPDKLLRTVLFSHVVNDVSRVVKVEKNLKASSKMQSIVFQILNGDDFALAKKMFSITAELCRRKVWMEPKVVNVLAELCFSKDSTLSLSAVRFLLGNFTDQDLEEEEEEEENARKAKDLREKAIHKGSKKTRKRMRQQEKLKKQASKLEKGKDEDEDGEEPTKASADGRAFGPISDLHNSQKFAERLFSALRDTNFRFEIRLEFLNLLSRVICCHRLVLVNFYSFLLRYLKPGQRFVTQILAYAIQAVHKFVPVEAVQPVIKCLSVEFVNDRSAAEAIAVGLNSIREICSRLPESMDRDLLSDLVEYKKFKDKGVVVAARSLIGVFRELAPEMLHRRDRGQPKKKSVEADGDPNSEPEEFDSDAEVSEELEDAADSGMEVSDVEENEFGEDVAEVDEENVEQEALVLAEEQLQEIAAEGLIDASEIECVTKKRRLDVEERVEKIKEKKKWSGQKEHGKTTNEEKLRLKPFHLVKFSRRVRAKVLGSQGSKNSKKSRHLSHMKTRDRHKKRLRKY